MHKIKYQQLKTNDNNNDDHQPLINNDNDDRQHYQVHNEHRTVVETKILCLLKLLFMCFVIIKIIYIINNYESIINWLNQPNTNQTEINENSIIFYWEETTENATKDRELKTIQSSGGLLNRNFTTSLNYEEITEKLYEEIEKSTELFYEEIEKSSEETSENLNEETDKSTEKLNEKSSEETTENLNEETEKSTENLYEKTEKSSEKTTEKLNVEKDSTITNTIPITDHEDDRKTTVIIPTINYLNDEITNTKNQKIFTTIILNDDTHNKHDVDATTTTLVYSNETLITSTMLPLTTIKSTLTLPPSPPVIVVPSTIPQKYFINTSRCHIPFVDPFNWEARKIFKPQHSTGCTRDEPIIKVSFDNVAGNYLLHINYTVANSLRKHSNISIEDDVVCCYQDILRSGSGNKVDSSFKLLPCSNFHQDFVVPLHIQGVITNCKSKSTKSTLQEDFFSFIQINKTIIQNEHPSRNNSSMRRKPSILMIGIDTLSRINFRRNMPEMYKYLVENEWHELMGYNKVGDNTLPNLMPLLAGYTRTTAYNNCKPQKVGGFDDCNFIWTNFKKHGYYTGYAEDTTTITTFNYHLKGFKKPPTDYYFRPMALAIEKSMKKKTKSGLSYCLGRKQFGEYIYDYGLEFATRYQNQTSFGFFWTNSFSHNSYDVSATMDKRMVKYFKEFEKRGIFDDSVVVFFSDHGARWGPLLKLSEGFLEERLPMFFISMPKWFRQEYPELMRNLEINQKRLVTPFDIHMTLQHLLQLGEPSYNITPAYDCPTCQTILQEIPENRTCDDASIPESWCTCIPFKTESTKSKKVQNITKLIIEEMNQYYERKNLTSLCSPLTLQEITKAKQHYKDEMMKPTNISTYVIDFTTNPKTDPRTVFSATVDYDTETQRIHLNVEDISRQSKYENTAKCTDDKQAKKYCICKNSLKKSPK